MQNRKAPRATNHRFKCNNLGLGIFSQERYLSHFIWWYVLLVGDIYGKRFSLAPTKIIISLETTH